MQTPRLMMKAVTRRTGITSKPGLATDQAGARGAGKFRLEGKEYVVHDGDALPFRFNV